MGGICVSAILLILVMCGVAQASPPEEARLLPEGTYMPFLSSKKQDVKVVPIAVKSFWLDVRAVTNREFLLFVKNHAVWRRSKVASVFADKSYLKHWKSDLVLKSPLDAEAPVTHVSWFAANAYCMAKGKSLPTNDQWEFAIEDLGRNQDQVKTQILEWYSTPNPKRFKTVTSVPKNGFGIQGLYGLVWEWTLDFNSLMAGPEARGDTTKDDNLFCGAGALNALDASDYAKFMRYSFRSSLNASYTTANLGFRCAGEKK